MAQLTTLATSLLSPIISMIRTTGSGTVRRGVERATMRGVGGGLHRRRTAAPQLPAANASYATAGTVFGQLIGGALFGLPMLIVGIAALVACTVRPRRGCCGTCAGNCLACCLCPLLVLILVLWFFGALFFGIAVVGSDFCYDPPAVVLSLLGSGSAIYPTAKYYVSPCGSVAVEGVFSSLQKMLLEAVSGGGGGGGLTHTAGMLVLLELLPLLFSLCAAVVFGELCLSEWSIT